MTLRLRATPSRRLLRPARIPCALRRAARALPRAPRENCEWIFSLVGDPYEARRAGGNCLVVVAVCETDGYRRRRNAARKDIECGWIEYQRCQSVLRRITVERSDA